MPLATPGGGSPLVVGRTRERMLLRAQVAAALAGHGGLVLLSGEAGIGKSTLAEEASREARNAGACVLTGYCYDHAETPPYGPWVEVLDQYRALRERAPGLHPIDAPVLTHGSSQSALFGAVRAFLVAIAAERPVMIVLDDVHWADTASLELLRFVARQLAAVPILLLITYRNDEVHREHPLYRLVPALVREALAVRIDVSTLSNDDARELIAHSYQLSDDDATRLANHLQQRALGNSFFLCELLRSLEGTILLPVAAEGWALGPLDHTPIPELLRQVIDARVARLGADAAELLAVAAIIGQVVPLAMWAEVSGMTEQTLLPLVERSVNANIVVATSDGLALRFAHVLIWEALYDSMLAPRRRIWHRQIGEALLAQEAAPDPDVVAYHLNRANDRRAVAWLIRAGERAQRAFAWRTAAERFETALALLDSDDSALNERGWLRVRLALLRRFEDPAAGIANLIEAERLGRETDDRALMAYARFHQGMLRCQSDDFRLGIAAEEAGIAMLDALSPVDRARLVAFETTSDPLDAQNGRGELTLALAESGQLTRASALGEHIIGLPLEQTFGSRGDAYYGLGCAYAALGQPDAARQAFAHAREIFNAHDYRSMVTASLFDELIAVILPYWTDQPHERARVETALLHSFAALNGIVDEHSACTARVVSNVLDGAWDEAFTMLERSDPRYVRRAMPALLAPIARHRGNTALAWSLVGEGLPGGPNTAPEDSAGYTLPLRTLAVALSLDAHAWDDARRWLAGLDHWLNWTGRVLGQADAHLCWASYHLALHDLPLARERAARALAAAENPRQPLTLLTAHRVQGEIDLAEGRLTEADAQVATALTLASLCGARHERAITILTQADILGARGDVSSALAHLDSVRAICRPLGATLTLARADELEARLRATAVRSPERLPAGLTAREAEVLRHLATGRSNAEIAQLLGLSPRTINAHLTAIYGKLGVTTRGAAIRFALDHDFR
ncbi:MAG: AAA family ATPase [Thermomicrobiales bacterium]|nr:AAA family ATPase [Thermomicrobiales bacterium]